MSVLDAIGGLIDSAKRLRSLAEELQSVELKSRIVDEIVRLQELREQAFADMNSHSVNSDNGKPTETVAENSQSEVVAARRGESAFCTTGTVGRGRDLFAFTR
jgi:hypothetical protein